MSWNKANGKVAQPRNGTHRRGILAGLVVVVGGGLAAYLMFGRPDVSTRSAERAARRSRIAEVTPQTTTKRHAGGAAKPEGPDLNARPTRVGEKVNGYIMMSDGTLHKMTGEAHTVGETPDPSQIFDNPAENEIAALLTIDPGEGIVGGPDRETFTEEFLKSTTVPIIVKSDDPDDIKALKRAVNQVKADLKLAYDRGEDIVGIMEKAYEDFQRLEQYKIDLFAEVLDYSENEEASEADVKDYLTAANKLLEQKGIAPLDDTTFIRTKIEYDHNIKRHN